MLGSVVFVTQLLPIDKLMSMPFQSRINREDPDFIDLVESIREHGLIEPIIVRPLHDLNANYEVMAGERRLKAAKELGFTVIPCHIKEVSDDVAIVLQAEENLQRKDYTEQDKIHLLTELASLKGWDAKEIAKRLHKSYTWAVLYLPDNFKDLQKAEAGQLGGIAKAGATRLVAGNGKSPLILTDVPVSSDLMNCDNCKMPTHVSRIQLLNLNLCPLCFEKMGVK